MIQNLYNWIRAYTGFAGYSFTFDRLEGHSRAAGIFFDGLQVLQRQPDINGIAKVRRRLTLSVLFNGCQDELLHFLAADFALWAPTAAPVLGQDQQIRAEVCGLHRNDGKGVITYKCRLIFEYTTWEEAGQ